MISSKKICNIYIVTVKISKLCLTFWVSNCGKILLFNAASWSSVTIIAVRDIADVSNYIALSRIVPYMDISRKKILMNAFLGHSLITVP